VRSPQEVLNTLMDLKDVQTLLTCYAQADLDTMREVMEQSQRCRASPGVSSLLTP
jgi:hypothetical protein